MIKYKCRNVILATLLAKNEEDIIQSTIENLLDQGVKYIILTDNNSTDHTLNIASKYKEIVEIIEEKDDDHNQSKWVTRMSQSALKYKPDWIIHCDSDEHWKGLQNLNQFQEQNIIGFTNEFLHPPCHEEFVLERQNAHLDFSNCGMIQQCKIAHRPIPNLIISHGNHDVKNDTIKTFSNVVWRHHYPIRSLTQWIQKSSNHLCLARRHSICERWKQWYQVIEKGEARTYYTSMITSYNEFLKNNSFENFLDMASYWASEENINYIKEKKILPELIR